MHIQVTQRNIDEGTQQSRIDCAVARSIKDKIGGAVPVNVYQQGAFVGHQRFEVGEKGRRFIELFDTDKKLVEPTDLTLSPYFGAAENVHDYHYQKYMHSKLSNSMMYQEVAVVMKNTKMDVGELKNWVVSYGSNF